MSEPRVEQLVAPETVAASAEPDRPLLMPGVQLAARRQEMNWSIEQVANQLNLAPRQIVAIEADDYAALPGMASLRGFIRAYAKLLKMDAAPLLLAIANEATAADALVPLRRALPSKPFTDNRLELANKRRIPSLSAILISLACVIIAVFATQQIGWISWLPKSLSLDVGEKWIQFVGKSSQQPSTAGSELIEPIIGNQVSDQRQQRPAGTVAKTAAPAKVDEAAESNGSLRASVALPAPATSPANGADDVVSNSKDLLVLNVRQDSWVEIRRGDNSPVFSRLIKAGETQAVKVVPPANLKVGNAAGVDATFRGAPLELQSNAQNNVARLTLK